MSVVFDKLAFVHTLETEGEFSRGQAEALSEAFHTAMSETVATRADLTTGIAEVRHEVAQTRAELKGDIGEMRSQIRELRSELKLWTGSLAGGLFAAISGLAVAMRFLGH
ncbi:MAG TPA: hypothetical protein VIJ55_15540 [Acetobacteraceae bacterium]